MKDVNLPAVEIIGYEGIWGVLMMVVLVYPALWFIPGPDHGHQEDLVDTLVMFYNSVYMAFSAVMETTSLNVVFVESSFFMPFQVDERICPDALANKGIPSELGGVALVSWLNLSWYLVTYSWQDAWTGIVKTRPFGGLFLLHLSLVQALLWDQKDKDITNFKLRHQEIKVEAV